MLHAGHEADLRFSLPFLSASPSPRVHPRARTHMLSHTPMHARAFSLSQKKSAELQLNSSLVPCSTGQLWAGHPMSELVPSHPPPGVAGERASPSVGEL